MVDLLWIVPLSKTGSCLYSYKYQSLLIVFTYSPHLTQFSHLCTPSFTSTVATSLISVDPTYFFQESILTEDLDDTPTFEVP